MLPRRLDENHNAERDRGKKSARVCARLSERTLMRPSTCQMPAFSCRQDWSPFCGD